MGNSAQRSEFPPSAPPGPLLVVAGVIVTLLGVLYTAVLAIFAAASAPFFNGHAVSYIGRLWGWLIIRTCGIKVEIQGLENLKGLKTCVFATNHQSFIDIFALSAFLPGEPRFVAKRELLKIPLFGYALDHSGHIAIDRDKGGQAIRRAIASTRNGYSIVVFAEGHRATDNRVHDFSDGAAWLAIATRQPCVPMAISGTGAMMPRGSKFVIPGMRMRIAIGEPIETRGLKSADRTELTRRLEAAVRARFVTEV